MRPRSLCCQLLVGTCYLHAVIDGYSLVAYVEGDGRDRPRRGRCARSRACLVRCPKHHGRPMAAAATGPHFCCGTCVELGIAHNRSRPYRPQISGKIERFHRTLVEGWAF
ncbi:transposase, partial [Tessaracoccus sp. OH4464_COT-324]